jgi:hypothetical protein
MTHEEWEDYVQEFNSSEVTVKIPKSTNFIPVNFSAFIFEGEPYLVKLVEFSNMELLETYLDETNNVALHFAYSMKSSGPQVVFARMCSISDGPAEKVPLEEYFEGVDLLESDEKFGTLEGIQQQINDASGDFAEFYYLKVGQNLILSIFDKQNMAVLV